jgi:vacuolar-type H+-ATPase subunit H
MDDMIEAIAAAEVRATQIKNTAVQKAGQIIEEARAKAAAIEREEAEKRAKYRAETIAAAEAKADDEYKTSLEYCRLKAKEYTKKVSSSTDFVVGKIVGRVSGGNC